MNCKSKKVEVYSLFDIRLCVTTSHFFQIEVLGCLSKDNCFRISSTMEHIFRIKAAMYSEKFTSKPQIYFEKSRNNCIAMLLAQSLQCLSTKTLQQKLIEPMFSRLFLFQTSQRSKYTGPQMRLAKQKFDIYQGRILELIKQICQTMNAFLEREFLELRSLQLWHLPIFISMRNMEVYSHNPILEFIYRWSVTRTVRVPLRLKFTQLYSKIVKILEFNLQIYLSGTILVLDYCVGTKQPNALNEPY